MWRAVLQIATNRILERDWCWWRWSLTRAAPPHAPSLQARTGASADQPLGAPRGCTACITSTNAVPEPDRGSAAPQHRPSCLHLTDHRHRILNYALLGQCDCCSACEGRRRPDGLETHLSPIAWGPVNFVGQFAFDPATAHPHGIDRRCAVARTTAASPPSGVFPPLMSVPQDLWAAVDIADNRILGKRSCFSSRRFW